jgi:hypothetical protein
MSFFPFLTILTLKKAQNTIFSTLDPSKQPYLGKVCINTTNQQSLNDEGIVTNIFETVDLEFSQRIYDIQSKSDILKLID